MVANCFSTPEFLINFIPNFGGSIGKEFKLQDFHWGE